MNLSFKKLTRNLILTYPKYILYSNYGYYHNPNANPGTNPNLSMYDHQPMDGQATTFVINKQFNGLPVFLHERHTVQYRVNLCCRLPRTRQDLLLSRLLDLWQTSARDSGLPHRTGGVMLGWHSGRGVVIARRPQSVWLETFRVR